MENTNLKLKLYIGLGALQGLIGLGALGGGIMLVIDPSGSTLGLPMSLLEGTLFPNYLIPGLFLLAVNGIGSLAGAALSFARSRFAKETAIILGAILVAWIVIQVIFIRSIGWLHVLYFVLGIIEAGIGFYISRHPHEADQ